MAREEMNINNLRLLRKCVQNAAITCTYYALEDRLEISLSLFAGKGKGSPSIIHIFSLFQENIRMKRRKGIGLRDLSETDYLLIPSFHRIFQLILKMLSAGLCFPQQSLQEENLAFSLLQLFFHASEALKGEIIRY